MWWLPSLIVVVVAAAFVSGVVFVARRTLRRRELERSDEVKELTRQAAISLVRADDAVQSAGDELGFAVAQFGEAATREFNEALQLARRRLRDAFALQQRLDDAGSDSQDRRRRLSAQILSLADEATRGVTDQVGRFDARRRVELAAPATIESARGQLEEIRRSLDAADELLARLGHRYQDPALAPLTTNLGAAREAFQEAQRRADAAAVATRVDAAAGDELHAFETALAEAVRLRGLFERSQRRLEETVDQLAQVQARAAAELTDARTIRDGQEEADVARAVNEQIAAVETVLHRLNADQGANQRSNPAADLAQLTRALDGLDLSRSHARNSRLRLENARTAFAGARRAAASQIDVTREFIDAHRSNVKVAARTRLAEAERLLGLADAEADPVIALDTARRAMTHATDADALARYDLL